MKITCRRRLSFEIRCRPGTSIFIVKIEVSQISVFPIFGYWNQGCRIPVIRGAEIEIRDFFGAPVFKIWLSRTSLRSESVVILDCLQRRPISSRRLIFLLKSEHIWYLYLEIVILIHFTRALIKLDEFAELSDVKIAHFRIRLVPRGLDRQLFYRRQRLFFSNLLLFDYFTGKKWVCASLRNGPYIWSQFKPL